MSKFHFTRQILPEMEYESCPRNMSSFARELEGEIDREWLGKTRKEREIKSNKEIYKNREIFRQIYICYR